MCMCMCVCIMKRKNISIFIKIQVLFDKYILIGYDVPVHSSSNNH